MCTLTAKTPYEQLHGTEPCRSLFSQYKINLPKSDTEHGSVTLNSNRLDVSDLPFFVLSTVNYPPPPLPVVLVHLPGRSTHNAFCDLSNALCVCVCIYLFYQFSFFLLGKISLHIEWLCNVLDSTGSKFLPHIYLFHFVILINS